MWFPDDYDISRLILGQWSNDLIETKQTCLCSQYPEGNIMHVQSKTGLVQCGQPKGVALLVFSGTPCGWPASRHGSPSKAVRPRDLTPCSHKPICIVTKYPNRCVVIMIITWHIQFQLVNIHHLKYEYGARNESRFARYSHCYVMWCPLMIWIVASMDAKGRCARNALFHTFDIGVFKSIWNKSATIKHI